MKRSLLLALIAVALVVVMVIGCQQSEKAVAPSPVAIATATHIANSTYRVIAGTVETFDFVGYTGIPDSTLAVEQIGKVLTFLNSGLARMRGPAPISDVNELDGIGIDGHGYSATGGFSSFGLNVPIKGLEGVYVGSLAQAKALARLVRQKLSTS